MSERYYEKYEAPVVKAKKVEVVKTQRVKTSAGEKSKPYSYALNLAKKGGEGAGAMTDELYK